MNRLNPWSLLQTMLAVAALIVALTGASVRVETEDLKNPGLTELMKSGPLEDMALGSNDARHTIIEYASMTCSHCAQFHQMVFPHLKAKYIDTGEVRFILREYPLDGPAIAAFMIVRCSGPTNYFALLDALFESQTTWVASKAEAQAWLYPVARMAGLSREQYNRCLMDKELFNEIMLVRQRAHEHFGVDSTPAFFVNGRRLVGEHLLNDFETALSR